MTLDDLAREAQISKKTIYLHFRNKEDVGLSSIGRVVETVHSHLEEVVDSSSRADEKLRKMLILRVMGRIESIKPYYWSLDELFAVVRPAYMAKRKIYFDHEVDLLTTVLEEGIEQGVLACSNPQDVAQALVLATNAFLPYSLSVRELGEPEAIAGRLKVMVEILMRGLVPSLARSYGD
jgi:AcrR family transcriptional regulator